MNLCLGGRAEDEVKTPSNIYGCGMRLNARPKCDACNPMGRVSFSGYVTETRNNEGVFYALLPGFEVSF